jgi:hypothetical protein
MASVQRFAELVEDQRTILVMAEHAARIGIGPRIEFVR